MSEPNLFERVLASLNACVLDDSRWPAASALIDQAFGATGGFLVYAGDRPQEDVDIFFARFCFGGERDFDLEREYFEDYHHRDERVPRARRLPDSRIVPSSALVNDGEKKTSVVYNELLPRVGGRDSLNVRLDGPGGTRIVWSTADPIEGAGWSSAQVHMMERVLPHIRHYVILREALVRARALGSSAAMLLENTRCGVIHLDRAGRIAAANDRARALLRQRGGLIDADGFLSAAAPEDDERLQELLAAALPRYGRSPASGSMTLTGLSQVPRLVLHATPLVDDTMESPATGTAVLVLVVEPVDRSAIDAGRVANLLGLTPTESRVAVAIARGASIRGVAGEMGCEQTTIRWHLRHIFAKLGISRQTELALIVRSVTELPQAPR